MNNSKFNCKDVGHWSALKTCIHITKYNGKAGKETLTRNVSMPVCLDLFCLENSVFDMRSLTSLRIGPHNVMDRMDRLGNS